MIRLEQVEKQYKNFHLDCSIEVQEGMRVAKLYVVKH